MTLTVRGNEIHFDGTLCAYIVAPLNLDDDFRRVIESITSAEGLCSSIGDSVEKLETVLEDFDRRCVLTQKRFEALQEVVEHIKDDKTPFEALAQFKTSLDAFKDHDFIDLHSVLSEASKVSEDLSRVLE